MPSQEPSPRLRSELLSSQVTRSSYFFLELGAESRTWTLALGGREQCAPDYVIDRNHYAYHVVEYVAEGRGELVLDGKSASLAPGTLFSYAPDMPCRICADARSPMKKFFFALAGRQAARRLGAACMPPGSVRTLAAHAELLSVAEDLIREGQRSGIQTAAICRTLMELFLLKVTEAASWAGKGSPIARDNFLRCKSLIDAHAERLGGLADLSREAGMDVSSICRLFRRFQGASPYQYLLRRKMNLAAELLMDRGCLVKEAAQLVGFSDPFHFARCFKAVHGVPPSAVRDFSREV